MRDIYNYVKHFSQKTKLRKFQRQKILAIKNDKFKRPHLMQKNNISDSNSPEDGATLQDKILLISALPNIG